jgi:hypothetical protein
MTVHHKPKGILKTKKNRWVSEFYSSHLYFDSLLMNLVSLVFEKLPAPDKFKLSHIHLWDHCYLYDVPYSTE